MGEDAWLTVGSGEPLLGPRLVLVTNLRDFVLVGADGSGSPARLEPFRLAEDADASGARWKTSCVRPRSVGAGLGEYLARALSHQATLAEPKDLAWPCGSTSKGLAWNR